MLNRLPKRVPSLSDMLVEIGRPKPAQVAKALDVHERTVNRWLREGRAPKPAMLSLFWLTKWGMQWLDAEVFNLAQMHMGMSQALKRELDQAKAENLRLQDQIGHLGRLGEFGSANDPMQGASGPGPAQPTPVAALSLLLTFTEFEQACARPTTQPQAEGVPRFTNRHARTISGALR
jgi:hypothetical protein